MTQNSNQFKQSGEQGQLDLQVTNGSVLPCQVSSSESGTITAGEAVKLEDSAGGVPKVLKLAANTDKTFGFFPLDFRKNSRVALESLNIAVFGSVMNMTAGAAIARGANLEVVYTTKKVITNASVNPVIGWAYDKAAADGDLIRVFITTPASMIPNLNLNDLRDVTITSPSNTEVVKYNGTVWVNAADAT
jgi:hypothetical protein